MHRGESAFAVLNLYPYSPGHLMVCPYRHVADYTDLTEEETVEVADAHPAGDARAAGASAAPTASTSGMNQGAVAGAGIAAHLHQHVVPRWGGDHNFMPVIGRTRTHAPAAGRHPRPARGRLAGVTSRSR